MSTMSIAKSGDASQIQELSFDEVESVNGGIIPLIVGGIVLLVFAAGAIDGWYDQGSKK